MMLNELYKGQTVFVPCKCHVQIGKLFPDEIEFTECEIIGIDYLKDEIEYFGKHFEEMKNEINFDSIPNVYLIEIIKNISN